MMTRTSLAITCTFLFSVGFAQTNWLGYDSGLQSVRSITTQGSDIYAVSFPSGVHKSTDDGANWNPVMSGLPTPGTNNYVRSIGRNATHLFAGTESGIYRSNNGGTSWTIANGTLPASNTVFANKFFQFGNTTFAVFNGNLAGGGGIYRTVNNGDTWLIGHSGMSANMVVYHLTYDNTTIYAATNLGIYVSTNLGQQWTVLNAAAAFDTFSVQKVGNRLVVISSFGYRFSTNNGQTWTNATGSFPPNITKGELVAYNGKLYAITGDSNLGCLVSNDNGSSYADFNTGLTALSIFGLEKFHASPTNLFIGTISDLYRIAGSTVDVTEAAANTLPAPFPTLFEDGFQLDLSSSGGNGTLIMLDAVGREVRRQDDLPAAPVRIERGSLVAGRYLCFLIDPVQGTRTPLGTVIAQ